MAIEPAHPYGPSTTVPGPSMPSTAITKADIAEVLLPLDDGYGLTPRPEDLRPRQSVDQGPCGECFSVFGYTTACMLEGAHGNPQSESAQQLAGPEGTPPVNNTTERWYSYLTAEVYQTIEISSIYSSTPEHYSMKPSTLDQPSTSSTNNLYFAPPPYQPALNYPAQAIPLDQPTTLFSNPTTNSARKQHSAFDQPSTSFSDTTTNPARNQGLVSQRGRDRKRAPPYTKRGARTKFVLWEPRLSDPWIIIT